MPNTNSRKRLCDSNENIEDNFKEKGTFVENPTLIQANEMYNRVWDQIELPEFNTSNRKRRIEQLNWRSVVDELRRMKK
jgi:hypothetical protein